MIAVGAALVEAEAVKRVFPGGIGVGAGVGIVVVAGRGGVAPVRAGPVTEGNVAGAETREGGVVLIDAVVDVGAGLGQCGVAVDIVLQGDAAEAIAATGINAAKVIVERIGAAVGEVRGGGAGEAIVGDGAGGIRAGRRVARAAKTHRLLRVAPVAAGGDAGAGGVLVVDKLPRPGVGAVVLEDGAGEGEAAARPLAGLVGAESDSAGASTFRGRCQTAVGVGVDARDGQCAGGAGGVAAVAGSVGARVSGGAGHGAHALVGLQVAAAISGARRAAVLEEHAAHAVAGVGVAACHVAAVAIGAGDVVRKRRRRLERVAIDTGRAVRGAVGAAGFIAVAQGTVGAAADGGRAGAVAGHGLHAGPHSGEAAGAGVGDHGTTQAVAAGGIGAATREAVGV